MDLSIDADELATCVSCGLCLPHCPTFRVTGEEAKSPRGRIAAMRAVQNEGAPVTPEFVTFIETCVQCRGCEPACHSGVPFGHLMEATRTTLAAARVITPWWQRVGFRVLGHHRLLLVGSTALALAQRAHLVPARLGLGRLPLRRGAPVRATGTDAWLFTGCVMDAWLRDVHRATAQVLDAIGIGYRTPGSGGACCGALHVHAGLTAEASSFAERVMASMPGDAPIVVNSAGCGAALKDYGHLLGTPAAVAFSARVVDVHELVAQHVDRLRPVRRMGWIIVQDPCHLRHVQRTHLAVRTVLGAVADLVELDDDGLCCGAGGAYSALEPELAGDIRDRKLAAISRAGSHVVASANPGCAMHLEAAGVAVRHPMSIVADALAKVEVGR
ncbi:MAG: heterodisulfide reductase-related iron-sulfur binding cluster [Ilumatobacteraceae bacterium]